MALRGAMDRLGTRAQEAYPGWRSGSSRLAAAQLLLVYALYRRDRYSSQAGARAPGSTIRNLYFIIVNGRHNPPASEISLTRHGFAAGAGSAARSLSAFLWRDSSPAASSTG